MLCRIAVVLLCPLLVAACSDLAALDGDGATPALSGSEQAAVRTQVDKALAGQRFKTAWNQEVAAGADRARLEAVALAALEAHSGHAADMFAALRTRHGALSSGARGRVDGLVAQAQDAASWSRALELELLTADDAPEYTRAWAVYRAAPPERAAALLQTIQDAKEEAAKQAAAKAAAKESGG